MRVIWGPAQMLHRMLATGDPAVRQVCAEHHLLDRIVTDLEAEAVDPESPVLDPRPDPVGSSPAQVHTCLMRQHCFSKAVSHHCIFYSRVDYFSCAVSHCFWYVF